VAGRFATAWISHAGGTWHTKSRAYTLFFGVAEASSSNGRVLRLRSLWSTAGSRRGILIQGAAAVLLRSFGAVGGKDEPPAAQAFELPHLSHPHHVTTLCSALVDRVAQNVIYGPIFPLCTGLQRRCSMPPHGLGMACKWEEQRTLRGRSRSVE